MTLEPRTESAPQNTESHPVTHARKRSLHAVGGSGSAPIAYLDAQRGRTDIVQCLRDLAAGRPGDLAFERRFEGGAPHASLTYAQLDRRARAIAAQLQDMRLAGQNVVLAYPPGLEFIAGFYGALYAGCVAVPAYPPRARTLDRFHALAVDAGAHVVLSTAAAVASMKALPGRIASLRWIATDTIADLHSDAWSEHEPDPETLAMIQYTSGSTSRPKGVMLSHANLLANTRAISNAFAVSRESKAVFWLPACHDMGLIGGILAPIHCGIPNTILAPALFVQNPFLWLDTISRSRATISGGPNFAYELCTRKITPEQRALLDLSSWSVAFIGAETIEPSTLSRFAEVFGPCGFRPASFYPCYGLAEATLMVSGPQAGSGATVRAFSDDALAHNRVLPLASDALQRPAACRMWRARRHAARCHRRTRDRPTNCIQRNWRDLGRRRFHRQRLLGRYR